MNKENLNKTSGFAEAKGSEMTMTSLAKEVEIDICGSGTILVNWGDGSPNETHNIILIDRTCDSYNLKHKYSNEDTHTITITGFENTVLTELYCDSNQLTDLDVSKNTTLEILWCEENLLSKLNVSKNIALTELCFRDNLLTSLDVSKNTALKGLCCSDNKLMSLDVSNNTGLTWLYCNNIQLTVLDVSKNTALTELCCYDNQIINLDVGKNTALTRLVCFFNLLQSSALNNLFETLHDNAISGYDGRCKEIEIYGNPGEEDCDIFIAEKKGWKVL